MAIAESIYTGPWLDFTITMKKKLILIMIRAQKPLEVSKSSADIYSMNFALFNSVSFFFPDTSGQRLPYDFRNVPITIECIIFLFHSFASCLQIN